MLCRRAPRVVVNSESRVTHHSPLTTHLPRSAFTLLEMVLAAAIGMVLMGALHVAVDYQFRHAQAGRELVERNLLARALLNRMSHEIAQSLALQAASPSQSGA